MSQDKGLTLILRFSDKRGKEEKDDCAHRPCAFIYSVKDQKEKAERFYRDILGGIAGTSATDSVASIFGKYFPWVIYPVWKYFAYGQKQLSGRLSGIREAGVHHITLQTPDIRKTMDYLEAHGIPFLVTMNIRKASGREVFIHPSHAFGVLIQIAEFNADDWLSARVRFPAGTKWQAEKTPGGARLTFAHPGGGKVSLELKREELKQLISELEESLS